jgi:hypothetical protein
LFKYLRRRKAAKTGTSDTFLEATGGGWSESPEVIATEGGTQADFVDLMLSQARAHALAEDIPVGQEFEFVITNIPNGISSPHEIAFGLMIQAGRFGLEPGTIMNEKVRFTRIE